MNRKLWFLVTLVFILAGFSGSAAAAPNQDKHTKVVHEGQTTRDVFLLGEDGIISGTVTDEVVVIKGNLTLTSTADIKDRVFIIGGKLTREPGAKVGEGVFHVNLQQDTLNSLLLGVGAFMGLELGKLCLGILIIIGSLMSLLLVKTHVNRGKSALQTQFVKTGLLGMLAAVGLSFLIIALIITIWGIPAALLLGAIIIILQSIGIGALSLLIGELLLKNYIWGQKPATQVLVGSLCIISFLNFPVFGMLWGIIIFIFAMGALTVSFVPGGNEVEI